MKSLVSRKTLPESIMRLTREGAVGCPISILTGFTYIYYMRHALKLLVVLTIVAAFHLFPTTASAHQGHQHASVVSVASEKVSRTVEYSAKIQNDKSSATVRTKQIDLGFSCPAGSGVNCSCGCSICSVAAMPLNSLLESNLSGKRSSLRFRSEILHARTPASTEHPPKFLA